MSDIITKDALRVEVEAASGGKQTVLYTAKGQPSYFNIFTKHQLENLHPSLGVGVHPAFVVNGIEKSEIFIGTYQAVIIDGEAVSLPGMAPTTNINFDAARAACFAAGHGFHLMTNWEWAALALRCVVNGQDVRGNTNCGASHSHPNEAGKCVNGSYVTLTGSGPDTWRHDGTPHGISDLVGNVWEWVDGLKLVGGKIIMPADNNFALPEAEWPETGACVDMPDCKPEISSIITERDWDGCTFSDTGVEEGFTPPVSLKQALLCPYEGLQVPGRFWADNNEDFEALPFRGGGWGNDSFAGLGALILGCERSLVHSDLGFRPAFIG